MSNNALENGLEKKAEEAIEALIVHPFTLLSLSDREKFHTGFLAYVINNKEFGLCVAKEIFAVSSTLPGWDKPVKALVEYNSIDLLLCRCDEFVNEACGTFSGLCKPKKNAIALAEVKLKTDLHSDQLKKYSNKIPETIRKKMPFFLMSLFPTIEPESVMGKFEAFDLCKIPDILERSKDIIEKDDTKLLSLWCTYLTALKAVREYFVKQGNEKINERIVAGLRKIKLIGIFQRYRFSLIKMRLQEDGCNSEPTIHNSHGEALLHLLLENKSNKVGLQWQYSNLKLFIEEDSKDNEGRDILLNKLASKLELSKVRLNRDGKFRSISWAEDWNIMDDINGRGEELAEKFQSVGKAWLEVIQPPTC